MAEVLEYYLIGGRLRIGKKEAAFELLRRDSILKALLGSGPGDVKALLSDPLRVGSGEDFVVLDFSLTGDRLLPGDPTNLLTELKQRYGDSVTGILHFKLLYTMWKQVYFLKADLDARPISLDPQ